MKTDRSNIVIRDDNPEQGLELESFIESDFDVTLLSSATTLIGYLSDRKTDALMVSASLLESYCLSVVLDVKERWPELPVIVMAGKPDQFDRMREVYLQVSDEVVSPPFDHPDILETLDRLLGIGAR